MQNILSEYSNAFTDRALVRTGFLSIASLLSGARNIGRGRGFELSRPTKGTDSSSVYDESKKLSSGCELDKTWPVLKRWPESALFQPREGK